MNRFVRTGERRYGNAERLGVEATLKRRGIGLLTQTHQLEEDVGGQRDTRILGERLRPKGKRGVIKRYVGEHEVDIQAHPRTDETPGGNNESGQNELEKRSQGGE